MSGVPVDEGTGEAQLRLHSWRRLDWRFLQPDLEPDTVAYGGAADAELVAALRLLDSDVRPLAELAVADRADLVVLVDPARHDLLQAVAAVRPGGWVCAEIRRSTVPGRPASLWGWRRVFSDAGLDNVAVYWHAPTLASSARIVPVADPTAVLSTLRRHHGVRFGRAKAAVGRLALALRLFAVAIPEGTVVGRRPEHGTAA
jgi:hypothetical protein